MLLSLYKDLRQLSSQTKKAIALLSISTFLEYFDLLLYMHMAFVLNDLFFPASDPTTKALAGAAGYASTFVLRPIWALIIGRMGDTIGRRATVVITIILASISCTIMALLPTYSEVGIIATGLFIFCRITQGFASMGEVIGADIYIMESTKPPIRYFMGGLTTVFASLGGFSALLLASTTGAWRIAFITAAFVTLLTGLARKALNETPEFLNAIQKMKDETALKKKPEIENFSFKTGFAIFAIDCGGPFAFYLLYMYCAPILTTQFGYSSIEVINHNLLISIAVFVNNILITLMSYRIYPLKMLKFRIFAFAFLVLFYPYIVSQAGSIAIIFLCQFLLASVPIDMISATPVILKHIPILRRFTYSGFIYALSRAVMHATTAFGFVYLLSKFGQQGALVIIVPVMALCIYGILYFEKLDRAD